MWWLQNNSVNGVAHAFNLAADLLPYPDAPEAPTDLIYHAAGAGALFARIELGARRRWLAFVAGKYDQSHAHQDRAAFTFFKDDWLAVTPNIWSHSGINRSVNVHNVIRFERADGSTIPQTSQRHRAVEHDRPPGPHGGGERGPQQRLLAEPRRGVQSGPVVSNCSTRRCW